MTAVIFCDPGAVGTGIVVRYRDHLIWHGLVMARAYPVTQAAVGKSTIDDAYLAGVAATLDTALDVGVGDAIRSRHIPDEPPTVGCEWIKYMGPGFSTLYVVQAAMVLGAVVAWTQQQQLPIVLVEPSSFGANYLATYPAPLVTAGEARKGLNRPAPNKSGASDIRHCRSAWDGAAAVRPTMLRTQSLSRRPGQVQMELPTGKATR